MPRLSLSIRKFKFLSRKRKINPAQHRINGDRMCLTLTIAQHLDILVTIFLQCLVTWRCQHAPTDSSVYFIFFSLLFKIILYFSYSNIASRISFLMRTSLRRQNFKAFVKAAREVHYYAEHHFHTNLKTVSCHQREGLCGTNSMCQGAIKK